MKTDSSPYKISADSYRKQIVWTPCTTVGGWLVWFLAYTIRCWHLRCMSNALRDGERKACAFAALGGLGRQADKHSVVRIWLCAKAAGVLGGGALTQRFCRAVLNHIDAAAGVVGVELDGQLLVRPSIQPVLHDTIAGDLAAVAARGRAKCAVAGVHLGHGGVAKQWADKAEEAGGCKHRLEALHTILPFVTIGVGFLQDGLLLMPRGSVYPVCAVCAVHPYLVCLVISGVWFNRRMHGIYPCDDARVREITS